MGQTADTTILNPAYWGEHPAQLAGILKSESGPPARIPDPTGQPGSPDSVVAVHDASYWGAHPAELANGLIRCGGDQTGPASASGVGVAPNAQERLTLTVEEAAAMLGISRAFAYEAVNRGELPHLRIGRRVLIPRAALDRMLEAAGQPSTE